MALIRQSQEQSAENNISPLGLYDILVNICRFLPPETVFNIVKLISVTHYEIICSEAFIRNHSTYYFPPDCFTSTHLPNNFFQKFVKTYQQFQRSLPHPYQQDELNDLTMRNDLSQDVVELVNSCRMVHYQITNACITEDLSSFKKIHEKDSGSLKQYNAFCDVILAPCPAAYSNEFFYTYLMRTNRTICLDYLVNFDFVSNNAQLANYHPFILAARLGRLDVMRNQLQKYPEWLNVRDHLQQSALLWAADHGYADIVQFLINKKASLRVRTFESDKNTESSGQTPLDWAMIKRRIHVIPILLKAYAETAPGFPHWISNPMFYAVEMGRLDVVQALYEYDKNLLLQVNDRGQTPLFVAVEQDRIDVLEYIIKVEPHLIYVPIKAKDPNDCHNGKIPLILAMEYVHREAAAILVKHLPFDEKQAIHAALSSLPDLIIKQVADKIESLSAPGQRLVLFHHPFQSFLTALKTRLENTKTQCANWSSAVILGNMFVIIQNTHNFDLSEIPANSALSEFLKQVASDAVRIAVGHTHYLSFAENQITIRIPSLYYFLLWKSIEEEMLAYNQVLQKVDRKHQLQ